MKSLLSLILTCSITLTGCSSFNTEAPDSNIKNNSIVTVSAKEKSRAKSLSDIYIPNPQVPDDTTLLSINQTINDDKGTSTLKNIASLNKTYHIGPVEMKIKNVKLLHTTPTYSLMDYFHGYTEHYIEFDYVKIEVELINTSSKTVHFGPIAHLKTNNGELVSFENDFYIEYLNGDIEANGSKQGAIGFIIEKTNPQITSLALQTSDVLDENQKIIHPSDTININF